MAKKDVLPPLVDLAFFDGAALMYVKFTKISLGRKHPQQHTLKNSCTACGQKVSTPIYSKFMAH